MSLDVELYLALKRIEDRLLAAEKLIEQVRFDLKARLEPGAPNPFVSFRDAVLHEVNKNERAR
jgi:hypothetical protein